MPAHIHGEILEADILAVLQHKRLVSPERGGLSQRVVPVTGYQTASVYHSLAADSYILQAYSPDQGILEVGMSVVLVFPAEFEGLGQVVTFGGCRHCSQQYGSFFQVEVYVAGQMHGIAGIASGREIDHPSSIGRRGGYGGVDSRGIYVDAVPFGTVIFHIMDGCLDKGQVQGQNGKDK